MSSQPPANSHPPQRSKDSWRLRGVHRAEPHLGEENQSPRIIWAIIAVFFLILLVVGAVFFFQSQPSSAIPTRMQTSTPVSSSSPTVTPASATQSPTLSNTPVSTTTTIPRPTAAIVRYRVRAGDTLSEIAQKFNVTVRAIMLANGLRNETIIEGEELIIPIATPRPPS